MLRRTLIAASAPALLLAVTAQAVPQRQVSTIERSVEGLDSTSTWIIVASVVGLAALILLLGNSEDELGPISP